MQQNHRTVRPRAATLLLVLCGLGLAGCVNNGDDLVTTASTAATTGYLIGEEAEEDDFARAREFAESNRVALRRDAARGGGENVAAFAALIDVSDPRAFGRWMQANYGALFRETRGRDDLVARIVAMRGADT